MSLWDNGSNHQIGVEHPHRPLSTKLSTKLTSGPKRQIVRCPTMFSLDERSVEHEQHKQVW
jgi:hypothetical protein